MELADLVETETEPLAGSASEGQSGPAPVVDPPPPLPPALVPPDPAMPVSPPAPLVPPPDSVPSEIAPPAPPCSPPVATGTSGVPTGSLVTVPPESASAPAEPTEASAQDPSLPHGEAVRCRSTALGTKVFATRSAKVLPLAVESPDESIPSMTMVTLPVRLDGVLMENSVGKTIGLLCGTPGNSKWSSVPALLTVTFN